MGVGLKNPPFVIFNETLLFKPDTRGREGLKIPIFAGRHLWMAPKQRLLHTTLKFKTN